jgi:hypothetical protein
MTIMVSHRGVRISSKVPHDKAGVTRLQDVQQATH